MKKLSIVILLFLLTGCVSAYSSGEGKTLEREMEYRGLGIVTDTKTGCQYILQIDAGVTPRLDSDGEPFCKKE